MELQQWKLKNSRARNYAHFDKRVSLNQVWNYISNPQKVASHGFYPFISYTKNYTKYNKDKGIVAKERNLCYSAHIDRYIFQYYGYLLNERYNARVIKDGLNNSVIAYRNNLGKNNIHFAKQAIDFIREKESCYIIVGDFEKFFNSLQHNYLKDMLCSLLEVKMLPPDYYAVYKNITKYSEWSMESILQLNGLKDTRKGRKQLNQRERVLSRQKFKENKRKNIIRNLKGCGIPQGSAISAVLSNIYMLNFDKMLNDYVLERNGLYMRYSDDFIIILPQSNKNNFRDEFTWIEKVICSFNGINIQKEKTEIFYYQNLNLINCNKDFLEESKSGKNFLNYLGFTFDGKIVTIRDKTISKYYYRMYKKLKTIIKNNGYTKNKKRISCKNFYEKYSIKGANIGKGNFITYVQKAEKVFGKDEAISRGTKNHMQKIRKKLDQIEYT